MDNQSTGYKPKSNSMDKKLKAVQKLIDTFRMERIIYVILTTISALSMIVIGLIAAVQGDYEIMLGTLVPTGTLTLCIFRVLKMWSDALKFLSNETEDHE